MSLHSIEKFDLKNGLQVVLENIPYRNSVSAGVWVPIGSRCESESEMGYSHFTEHMLFKGTKNRSYQQISLEIDRLGGYMNASTSKEITNYYITLSPKFTPVALDVLSDIFFESVLPSNEFEVEKKVILEEIKMGQDNPDDHLFDLFYEDHFGDTPLGRPIPGTQESISKATREDLYGYYTGNYGSQSSVLSLAGGLWDSENEKSKLMSGVQKFFGDKQMPGQGSGFQKTEEVQPKPKRLVRHQRKQLEQVHFAFGIPGLSEQEERNAYLQVFTHLMGGTMSSRLFRKLREENGLCYSVGSFHSQFYHEGLWGVYCGTSKKSFLDSVQLMMEVLQNSLARDIPQNEVEEAKAGLSGTIELSMELPIHRAGFNARSLLYHGELRDWKQKIKEIEALKPDAMMKAVRALWSGKEYTLTSLGDLDPEKTENAIQKLHPSALLN